MEREASNPLKRQLWRVILAAFALILMVPPARTQQGSASPKSAQEKPKVSIDLRPLGVAPDLFVDLSDTKYAQRAIATVFWLDNNRLAVAFSTTHRWSSSEKPEPLQVRLIVFNSSGQQLNERAWDLGSEGPEAETNLQISVGPDNAILVVHGTIAQAPGAGRIPEGDFIQVLNPDASLRQNFYVPASSASVVGSASDSRLLLQTFYADKHTSLAWWAGNPLKSEATLNLPPGSEETLAGPGVAARTICANQDSVSAALGVKPLCTGIRIFRPGGPPWILFSPSPELSPVPRTFLRPTALLVEMRDSDGKVKGWFIAHPDGTQTQLPPLPKSLEAFTVSGVSADGNRFSIDTGGEAGLCGALKLFCRDTGSAMVIDVSANRIVSEEPLSIYGSQSTLSPDGKQLATLDRNKLTIYDLP